MKDLKRVHDILVAGQARTSMMHRYQIEIQGRWYTIMDTRCDILKERSVIPGSQFTTNHTSGSYTNGHDIQLPTQVTPACPLQGHDGCHGAITLQQRFTSHTDSSIFIVLLFPTQVTKLIFTSPTDILCMHRQSHQRTKNGRPGG